MTDLIGITTDIVTPVVTPRTWSLQARGVNDRPVDIWYNNKWVPAFFSDIKKGDFFLGLNSNLEPGACYRAFSNVSASTYHGITSFHITGMEIVQAPEVHTTEPRLINEQQSKYQIE